MLTVQSKPYKYAIEEAFARPESLSRLIIQNSIIILLLTFNKEYTQKEIHTVSEIKC